MNDDLAAKMFPSMGPADAPTAPAPSTTPDQEAQLRSAFGSMSDAPPPTSETQDTEPAASRVSAPAASEPTAPTDASEPTPVILESANVQVEIPAGLAPDVLALQEVDGIAADLGLDGAAVQRFVDVHSQAMERAVSAAETEITESWSRVTRGWAAQAEKDAEIGGSAFKDNLRLARSVLDRHPGFKAAVKSLGIGNHPELIRFLCRVARAPAGSSDAAALQAFPSMK